MKDRIFDAMIAVGLLAVVVLTLWGTKIFLWGS